jgi:hypothetical protein
MKSVVCIAITYRHLSRNKLQTLKQANQFPVPPLANVSAKEAENCISTMNLGFYIKKQILLTFQERGICYTRYINLLAVIFCII